jgi:membrane-associated phospholipid phosphatase
MRMSPLEAFGVSFITAFQSMGPWLEAPMKAFSFLGSEDFFLIFMPLVYWSIDAGLGVRAGVILLAGTGLNLLFKMGMHGPRPFWVSTKVSGLASETGFGVPSGHSQIGAGLWGMVAAYYRKAWVWVAAVTLVFFIGLSRLYLGVHFPHDVLVGWALGFLTLWAVVRWWDPIEVRVRAMPFWNQVGLAFGVSLAMVLLGVLILALSRTFVLPAEWIANATRDGGLAPNPLSLDGVITAAATLFGLWAGLAWMAPRGGFEASGPLWKRAARYAVGLIGVLVIYAGLKAIFPSGDNALAYTFRYVRYTFLGLWVFAGAPWTFARLSLTEDR